MTGGTGAVPEPVADVGVGNGWAGSVSGMTIGDWVNSRSKRLVVVVVVVVVDETPWLASM